MDRTRRAFTLTELLVVLAVVALLSALLFPVLGSSKASAAKSVCASNFRQAYLATGLYLSDYDDTFLPINHQPAEEPNSQNDRTWVQMLLPYLRSYDVFRCPADMSPRPHTEASFDRDLVPGDVYSRYYTASLRSNIGYNYLYLAPVVREAGGWVSRPRIATQVSRPSQMLLYVDSVWDRDAMGRPIGGGNWLVIPPCRYRPLAGSARDSFEIVGRDVFAASPGWQVADERAGLHFGGAWPWHDGRMTVLHVDGSAISLTPSLLAVGCDVEANWTGLIDDNGNYIWDLD